VAALDPRAPASGTPAWFVREHPLPHGRWAVRGVLDPSHEDGMVLDDPVDTSGMYVFWRAGLDAQGRLAVLPTAMEVPGVPELWFVDLGEDPAAPGLQTLVAFASDHLPAGTVVPNAVFFSMSVRSREQVGAIRWARASGAVDQLYVAADWRRRGIGTLLLQSAGAFHQAHGWHGVIHSDGRHTRLGDAFASAQWFPQRLPAEVRLMPPMDPEDQPGG
jgi:GNAT superfamily N-acetyltransferase